jgi:hypothetical protein
MARTNVVADAVRKIGGVAVAARELEVAPDIVEEWIAKGTMKDARYEHVIRLSRFALISPEHLAPLDP